MSLFFRALFVVPSIAQLSGGVPPPPLGVGSGLRVDIWCAPWVEAIYIVDEKSYV